MLGKTLAKDKGFHLFKSIVAYMYIHTKEIHVYPIVNGYNSI